MKRLEDILDQFGIDLAEALCIAYESDAKLEAAEAELENLSGAPPDIVSPLPESCALNS